jgi:hypothetical protein
MSEITRTQFAQAPIELIESCTDRQRKGWLFVYLWLWHYAGKDDQAFPSVARLALECRMNTEDTRRALAWLTTEGWIERVDRPGRTSLFHVRTERCVRNPHRRRRSERTPTPKGGGVPDPYARRGTPTPEGGVPEGVPLRLKGYPPLGTPNKKKTYKPLEELPVYVSRGVQGGVPTPPVSAVADTGQGPDEPSAPATQIETQTESGTLAPPPPEPKPPAKRRRFTPGPEHVPLDLQPLADDLLGFWAGKQGARSERAWSLLLGEVRRIRDDRQGGLEVAGTQLQAGTQAGWQSVTHANWQRYGLNTRNGPSDHPYLQHLHGARPSRTEVAAANVHRLIDTGEHWLAQP